MFSTFDRFLGATFDFWQAIEEMCGASTVSGVLPQGVGRSGSQRAIVCKDLSLYTVFHVDGTKHVYGDAELHTHWRRLSEALSSILKLNGHTLQFTIHYDRDSAPAHVQSMFEPIIQSCIRREINVAPVMEDWAKTVSSYTADEEMLIVAWTHPWVLPSSTLKKEQKLLAKKVLPVPAGCIPDNYQIDSLFIQHTNYISSIRAALNKAELIFSELTPEMATWHLRRMADAEYTSADWRPHLPKYMREKPGEKSFSFPPPMPGRGAKLKVGTGYPDLAHQLLPRDALVRGNEFVVIGNRIHYPFTMKLGPQTPTPFKSGFFNEIIKHPFSWRMTWNIRGGQHAGQNLASILARLFFFCSNTNRLINSAVHELTLMEQKGTTLVGLQVAYDTWVDMPESSEAYYKVQSQMAQFAGAIQAWGEQETQTVVGDPYAAFLATIPGLSYKSPGAITIAPLSEVIRLLPLCERPASAWKNGIPLRSPDGKIFPYAPMSKQPAFISAGLAPMGSGKSVWANTENLFFAFNPALMELPYSGTIDIGPSSSGFIKLVQEALPAGKRHLAAYHLLENNTEHGINVFDTPLGVRYPFRIQRDFLKNFLCVLATPVSAKAPYDGINALAGQCISAAYKMSDDKARPYTRKLDPAVDRAVDGYNLTVDTYTTWWEIVDQLFQCGAVHEATLAQRHAVPTLPDIASCANDHAIVSQYANNRVESGELLCEFFYRKLMEANEDYPVLSGLTKFDIGEARIVSLDLNKFTASGAESSKRMAVMFMVAQQILAGKYYEDLEDIDSVPSLYKAFHTKRIAEMKRLPKKLSIDEFHRIGKSDSVFARLFVADFCSRARETRKWNVALSLYTQFFTDLPQELVELLTSIYVFGAGTETSVQSFCATYNLSPAVQEAISGISKPGKQGASMFAYYKTDVGNVYHVVTSTLGKRMLWALSSTAEDVYVRNKLYEILGVVETLEILSTLYPNGSIKDIATERQLRYNAKKINKDALEEIVEECLLWAEKRKLAQVTRTP